MPPHRILLLQAAEATKLVAGAGQHATEQASKDGSAIPWFLFLLALAAMTLLAILYWKEIKAKNTDIQSAVQKAREEDAKEIALNNGHADDLYKQLKGVYESQIRNLTDSNDRSLRELKEINEKLREADKEGVKVIGAVGTALNNLTTVIQGVQFQLVTIETMLSGRPPQAPPLRPPTLPPPAI